MPRRNRRRKVRHPKLDETERTMSYEAMARSLVVRGLASPRVLGPLLQPWPATGGTPQSRRPTSPGPQQSSVPPTARTLSQ